MASGTYILGGLAGMLIAYLDEQAIDLPPLRATLSKRTPAEQVPIESWWEWLEAIQRAHSRPALGIHIGRHIQPHHIGVLGYLLLSCDNGSQVLDSFQRFQPLLHNLNPSSATINGPRLRIAWDYSYGTSTQLSNEVLLSSFLTNIRTFVGNTGIKFLRITFPGAVPQYSDLYEELLECPVEFSAKSLSLELETAWLLEKIPTADPHLRDVLVKQAESLMETTPRPDPFIKSLEFEILQAVPDGDISAATIAQTLGIPLRSFYRRLDQRGVNFRLLLQSIRYQLAKQYLSDNNIKLTEISSLLGYSEQSAFGRAFKQWHGTTPNRYRDLIKAEGLKYQNKI
ncbi:helix-turn-helix domain-containing protein [Zhongshania sp.]|uniref:helix-turn-helix domain-containing protein n=1 Tax=Zhongshania sp. TaxID=1971902 RepID=UPI002A7EB349|nr:AraC family transcriptional regulator ligand-binding domain-containing protein [Zhongshania sp.]